MGKKISIVITTVLALCVLVVSCGGGGGGGGGGSSTVADSSNTTTFSGSFTVAGGSYNLLSMTGTASSGNVTLSGSSGTLTGTYSTGGASARVNDSGLFTSIQSGTYTITFSNGTISVTTNGTNCSVSGGTLAASGSATLDPLVGTWVETWVEEGDNYKLVVIFNGLTIRVKGYFNNEFVFDISEPYTVSGNTLNLDSRNPTFHYDPYDLRDEWMPSTETANFIINGNQLTVYQWRSSDGSVYTDDVLTRQ